MISRLAMVTAATDVNLLTLDELKEATGVTGSLQDAALTALGLRISSAIANLCRVPQVGVSPITFKEEVIKETFFELNSWSSFLLLARRPVTAVSLVADPRGTYDPANYSFGADGLLMMTNGWPYDQLEVTYTCGWATIPADLKMAASLLAKDSWTSLTSDSSLRSETVEGIGTFNYLNSSSSSSGALTIGTNVSQLLQPYMYLSIG